MSQDELLINGDLLRLRREARGWVLNDMASRACMSVKQIRQLEEGGTSSFYSPAVKFTAAKKVGALLGLSPDQVFAQDAATTPVVDASLADAVPSAPGVADVNLHAKVQEPVSAEDLVQVPKSKTSLWVMAALFVAALAVAAYLQPQDEQVLEPAPALQVMPPEAVEPASAASASEALPVASSVAPVVARVASSAAAVQPIASAATKAP